jgi:hypothetical protein
MFDLDRKKRRQVVSARQQADTRRIPGTGRPKSPRRENRRNFGAEAAGN